MNDLSRIASRQDDDIALYRRVRAAMPALAAGLSAEDLAAQAMPDASPGKWHLAHTSWFFEAMILAADPDYEPVDPRFQQMFNSYYEALGARVARQDRGLMTRPSIDDVLAYRSEIDRRMMDRLARGLTSGADRYLFVLGLHHDQQHQELFVMDILALMAKSPLDPVAYDVEPRRAATQDALGGVERFDGDLATIGNDGRGFGFDNEGPVHPVWLQPFALARDLVTNAEWIAFIEDGGYSRPELWLADGWATVKAEGWTAPLYWRADPAGWTTMSLTGRVPVDTTTPVRHVSAYEADAFATWAGRRLPTEAEWEHAATDKRPDSFSATCSARSGSTRPAPTRPTQASGPTEGTAVGVQRQVHGQPNAFCAAHASRRLPATIALTYRNFFYPHQRWAFMGLYDWPKTLP